MFFDPDFFLAHNHNVVMLGGLRTGKTSLLSSMLSALNQQSYFTVIDRTDYSKGALPLSHYKNGLKPYLQVRKTNSSFLVDFSPTFGVQNYQFEVRPLGVNKGVNLFINDYPGNFLEIRAEFLSQLVSRPDSDVFIITIDTPFAMQDDEDVNFVKNRIGDISNLLMCNLNINNQQDRKLIILCPLKCEYWIKRGLALSIVEKVKSMYKSLIEFCQNWSVETWIMPVQTVGGIEFSNMMPAKLFFRDEDDLQGTSCSFYEDTGLIVLKDGTLIDADEAHRIEDDSDWVIEYTPIPLSWYRLNGDGYAPQWCEQPFYHILRFLVEKEENINNTVPAPVAPWGVNRQVAMKKLYSMPFGKMLPAYKSQILKMYQERKIKTSGDGFVRIC